jgi:hypothetical protein
MFVHRDRRLLSRRHWHWEVAFLLTFMLGCQPRQPNTELHDVLTPTAPRVPEGPYTLRGTVTEFGTGRPLADVLVEASLQRTRTNENGYYEFPRMGRTEISFSKMDSRGRHLRSSP